MESVPALVGKRWVTQWVLWMGSVGFREPKKDGRHPGCGFLQSFQSCSCGRGELGVAESSGCHVHGQVGRESLICRCLLLASSAQKPEGRGVKWFPEEQGRKRQKGGPNEGCLHRSFPLPSLSPMLHWTWGLSVASQQKGAGQFARHTKNSPSPLWNDNTL